MTSTKTNTSTVLSRAALGVFAGLTLLLAACGGGGGETAGSNDIVNTVPDTTETPTTGDSQPGTQPETQPDTLPEPKVVGDSCTATCSNGDVISIQCAASETPVCDCAAAPRTHCAGSEGS